MHQLLWRLLGTPPWAADIITNQEAIMASQAENQKRIDELGASLEASEARQKKAHGEILKAVGELREQAAAANQELDFTGVEKAAGGLASGAQELDDLNEDETSEPSTPEVPATPETPAAETPEAPANPVADGASVDGAPQA